MEALELSLYNPGHLEGAIEIASGTLVRIAGSAASGKTTIFTALTMTQISGECVIAGRRYETMSERERAELRRSVGSATQRDLFVPGRSVAENIALVCLARGEAEKAAEQVDEVLKALELTAYENRSIDALSFSEREQIAVARALVGKPRLIVIDSVNCDPIWLMAALKNRSTTIVWLSETFDVADYTLVDGRIVPIKTAGVECTQ